MSKHLIRLALTPAQLCMVNSALALLEADPEEIGDSGESAAVMERTRRKVWDAMIRWKVEP